MWIVPQFLNLTFPPSCILTTVGENELSITLTPVNAEEVELSSHDVNRTVDKKNIIKPKKRLFFTSIIIKFSFKKFMIILITI